MTKARRSVPTLLLAPTILCLLRCSGPSVPNARPRPPTATTTAATTSAATTSAAARLTVEVTDLRNGNGDLLVGVFAAADGFPSDHAKSVAWQVGPAGGTAVFTFDLPPGRYAVGVLHDENRNGKMDTGLFGIPKEGYGVTNNPKPRRRAATFGEATFVLPPAGRSIDISIQYDFL